VDVPKYFDVPEDEESTVYTVCAKNDDGLFIEITAHGYKSQSQNRQFYVKNNEYFLVDVKITNESNVPLYQYLPTSCRDASPAHNHEIGFEISSKDHQLHSSSFGLACTEKAEVWTVEPGQSYEWQLKLAAGSSMPQVSLHPDKKDPDDAKSSGFVHYETKFDASFNGTMIYESTYVNFGSGAVGSDFNFIVNGGSGLPGYVIIGGSGAGFLPSDGDEKAGLLLYGHEIFSDNICNFGGSFFFEYMKSGDGAENALSLSVPFSVDVVYVSPVPNK